MKNTTIQIGTNTFQVEQFIPTGYRVRLVVGENQSIFVGVLSKNKIDKSGRVRGQGLFSDAGHNYEYKWVGNCIASRVDTWADTFTIKQALNAIKQTWIETLV